MEYFYFLFLAAEIVLGYLYITHPGVLKYKMAASVPFVAAGIYLTVISGRLTLPYALLIILVFFIPERKRAAE